MRLSMTKMNSDGSRHFGNGGEAELARIRERERLDKKKRGKGEESESIPFRRRRNVGVRGRLHLDTTASRVRLLVRVRHQLLDIYDSRWAINRVKKLISFTISAFSPPPPPRRHKI